MIPWGLLGRKVITRPCSTLSHKYTSKSENLPTYLLLAAMYGVELGSGMWRCTCDVAETLSLAVPTIGKALARLVITVAPHKDI
jgi:hypothetical protein